MAFRYRCYGAEIESDVTLDPLVESVGQGPPDIRHSLRAGPRTPVGEVVYESPFKLADGDAALRAHRDGATVWMDYPGMAVFEVRGSSIASYPSAPGNELWQRWLVGPVLASCVETMGDTTLHAGAVEIDGSAAAFVGASTAGKSSLTASLVDSGRRLLADDVLAVCSDGGIAVAQPAFPSMRMWPELACHHFGEHMPAGTTGGGRSKFFVPVGTTWGEFCSDAVPLGAVFVLDRGPATSEARLERLAGPTAVMQLVQHSFPTRLLTGLGLQPARLGRIAGIVEHTPVYRLEYPTGLDELPRIHELIADVVTQT